MPSAAHGSPEPDEREPPPEAEDRPPPGTLRTRNLGRSQDGDLLVTRFAPKRCGIALMHLPAVAPTVKLLSWARRQDNRTDEGFDAFRRMYLEQLRALHRTPEGHAALDGLGAVAASHGLTLVCFCPADPRDPARTRCHRITLAHAVAAMSAKAGRPLVLDLG